jgi:hypothetical protein
MEKAYSIEEGLCLKNGKEFFFKKMSRCRIKNKPYYRVYDGIDTFVPYDEKVFEIKFKVKEKR